MLGKIPSSLVGKLTEGQARLLLMMGWGLLIRMLLMPFFAHVDFLSEYGRMQQIVTTGNYTLYLGRPIVVLIQLITLIFFQPLIPDGGILLSFGEISQSTASVLDYYFFTGSPLVFRTLFLLKIPYLVFDLGTAVIIYRIMEQKEKQKTAVMLWLFNPITLYAFYVFGRFESIPLFFIASACLVMMRKHIVAAAALMGIALNCREIIILLIPLFCLSIVEFPIDLKRILKTVIPAVLLLASLYGIPLWLKTNFEFRVPGVLPQSDIKPAYGLLAMQYNWFLPFIFAYIGVCLWILETGKSVLYRFILSAGLSMMFFLMIVAHSAHYVSWMILFPILMLGYDRDILKPFTVFCLAWTAVWAIMTDAGVFTLFLASPLSIDFAGFQTVPQIYSRHFGPQSFLKLSNAIWICRNGYAACICWLMYKTLKRPVHGNV